MPRKDWDIMIYELAIENDNVYKYPRYFELKRRIHLGTASQWSLREAIGRIA